MMSFKNREVFPGVYHIQDCMGVCMTLVAGSKYALLADAGYGLESVSETVKELTDLPCRLILTHGHHDHALGAMWFDDVILHPDDRSVYALYTSKAQRQIVLSQAAEKGLEPDESVYLDRTMPDPEAPQTDMMELGGLHVQLLHCPGHTPGSLMLYIPEYRLLLPGDNWNPTAWLFFPEALGVREYLRNMRRCLRDLPIETVLCPHSYETQSMKTMSAFMEGLTDECLKAAQPCPEGISRGIRTMRCEPSPGQQLIFDADKLEII